MNEMDMMSPEKVAAKYGGDKQKIGQAAQMGLLNPTVAVMAGMFIDRMRGAAAQEQTPQSTVAQDTMAAPAGLGAVSQAPMEGGLEALPTPNLDNAEYAGGGIVAFANGGMSQMESDQEAMIDTLKRMGYSMADIATMVPRGLMGAFNAGVLRPARAITGLDIPYAKDILAPEGSNFSSMTPFYDQLRNPKTTPTSTSTAAAEFADRKEREDADTLGTIKNVAKKRTVDEAAKKTATAKDAAPAKEETSEDFLTRRKRMLAAAGVSEDPFGADREAARTRADEIAAQRKENQAISMIMGGLSGMSGRNLAEFAQKAGTAGFGQYMKGEKEAREDQKEIDKINRDLNKAEDAMKRGDVDKALEFEDKAKQREIQLRGVRAQERAAAVDRTPAEIQLIERYAKDKGLSFSQALREVSGVKAEPKSRDAALKDWSGNILLQRQYPSFEDYYSSTRVGGGGGGFKVLGKEGG
jgi:hypothetical protein